MHVANDDVRCKVEGKDKLLLLLVVVMGILYSGLVGGLGVRVDGRLIDRLVRPVSISFEKSLLSRLLLKLKDSYWDISPVKLFGQVRSSANRPYSYPAREVGFRLRRGVNHTHLKFEFDLAV